MSTIHIGGVPEHFNLPWHLGIEKNLFNQEAIDLKWKDFPGGTGAMCEALRKKELDIAIILTEGIIKDILAGNPAKIVQTYVESPLVWGVHVDKNAPFQSVADLENTTAAISRYGSGSHLMSYVFADQNGWDLSLLKFEIVKNLEGAIEALQNKTADYFMWEHFTTKPLVDNYTFRRITDCPTPWPCFVIAVRNEVLEQKPSEIQIILKIINKLTKDFKNIPDIDLILAKRYEQQLADIREWLSKTTWSQSILAEPEIINIQDQLHTLDIVQKTEKPDFFLHHI